MSTPASPDPIPAPATPSARRSTGAGEPAAPAAPNPAAPPPLERRRLTRLVIALGVSTVVSYGTLYYAIAVLWPPIGVDLGIGKAALFGVVSASLLVSGLSAPHVGRWIDGIGGWPVMVGGSVLAAVAMGVLAIAQGFGGYVLGWVLAGFAMSLTLYEAAFGTLARHAGAAYRRALTALTLIGGFASTVFWPLTAYLLDAFGWRGTFGVFAALHILVCVPLHAWAIPRRRAPRPALRASPAPGGGRDPGGQDAAALQPPPREPTPAPSPRVFAWLAAAFALLAFIMSSISLHLMSLLQARGLGLADAVLVGMAIGPMQVAGRLVDLLAAARLDALRAGYLAFVAIVLGTATLAAGGASIGAGLIFAALYGAGNGLQTIVKGMSVAVLFGRDQYATWLGRLGRWSQLMHAGAPFLVASLLDAGIDYERIAWLLLIAAAAALGCFRLALVSHAR